MHVILRFELERDLFAGRVAVGGLPARWNGLMDKYLGVVPPTDREGVLQVRRRPAGRRPNDRDRSAARAEEWGGGKGGGVKRAAEGGGGGCRLSSCLYLLRACAPVLISLPPSLSFPPTFSPLFGCLSLYSLLYSLSLSLSLCSVLLSPSLPPSL
jgi:hypothetical protein